MGSSKHGFSHVFLIIATILQILSVCQAYQFFVGGKDGWVSNPSENFNHWAERNRFRVNDTLFFKYKQGTDSVLVVKPDDYNTCNTATPLLSLADGGSVFTFDRSGPFFFISGNAQNCQKGQKLIVVVMAVRNNKPQPAASAPAPASSSSSVVPQPPTAAPPSGAQSPGGESPSVDPSKLDAPAPAPNASSGYSGGLFGLVVYAGLGMSLSFVLGY
ncbi:early nodulin-like protein 3 [Humulus lupulus]|uniref:early nodulin-like protein 3 n=1 Tax=Humulus lupulus TaxID=3486 RepID=UPI002B40D262|nr:early nodulin-like protein 3 [Humulus lupulus]